MPQNLDQDLLRRLLAINPGTGSVDGYTPSYDFTGIGDAGNMPTLTGITQRTADSGGRYGLGTFDQYSPSGEFQNSGDYQPVNNTKDFLDFLALATAALGGVAGMGFDVGLFDAMGLGGGSSLGGGGIGGAESASFADMAAGLDPAFGSLGGGADAVAAGAGGAGSWSSGLADLLASPGAVSLSPEQLAALQASAGSAYTPAIAASVMESLPVLGGALAGGALAGDAAFADMAAGLNPSGPGATSFNPASGVSNVANGVGATGLLDGILNGISNNPLGAIGAIGGALGGASQGAPTESRQNRMDPRMDPYVYGNDGVLSAAQRMYRDNPSGVNTNMRAGFDRTLGLLNDPSISAGYGNMRNVGQGLLNTQVAGNPFHSRSGMSGFGTSRMDEFLSRRGR